MVWLWTEGEIPSSLLTVTINALFNGRFRVQEVGKQSFHIYLALDWRWMNKVFSTFLIGPDSEVRRWRVGESQGALVAGGNGCGSRLNQLRGPMTNLCRSESFCLCVRTTTMTEWWNGWRGATEGIIVAGGQGKGSALSQLNVPEGVIVDQLGTLYIADRYNHRIVRWKKEQQQEKF